MFFPEKLARVTLREKLILWDKEYEHCDFKQIKEWSASTVSEVVFHPNWHSEILEHWRITEDRGNRTRFRRPRRRPAERELENWEVVNGVNYRTWRIHKFADPVKFACGDKYFPPVSKWNKPKDHSGCIVKWNWRVHPTGKERLSTTISTRVERNSEVHRRELPKRVIQPPEDWDINYPLQRVDSAGDH